MLKLTWTKLRIEAANFLDPHNLRLELENKFDETIVIIEIVGIFVKYDNGFIERRQEYTKSIRPKTKEPLTFSFEIDTNFQASTNSYKFRVTYQRGAEKEYAILDSWASLNIKPARKSDLKVFISYKMNKDETYRDILSTQLKNAGFNPVYAPEITKMGNNLDSITKAIHDSNLIVVIWTEDASRSKFVKSEIAYALENDKEIRILRNNDTLHPDELKNIHSHELNPECPIDDIAKFMRYINEQFKRGEIGENT